MIAHSVQGRLAGQWFYQDLNGQDVLCVVRFETASGKSFRPVYKTEAGWKIGTPAGQLPLYRLHDLQDATRVYVTEGEKAADAARSIGLVATTSAHGANSAQRSDWSPLADRDVVILPDNDEAGLKYADSVVEILAKQVSNAKIKIVELPDLPEHGDIHDFLECQDAMEPESLREEIERIAGQSMANLIQPAEPALPCYQPFPENLLPEPARSFTIVASDAIGCDPSYIALPLLSMLASTIGNSRHIELKQGWSEPAILWTAIVGESGSLKTPAFKAVMTALRAIQNKLIGEYEKQFAEYVTSKLCFEKVKAEWNRTKTHEDPLEPPQPPIAVRYVVSDTTVEALVPILKSNPRGVLMARDELAGWIASFDRYAKSSGADSAHWLSMHNGETLIVDRKTGIPPTLYVPRASVSVTGGIQPGILSRALSLEHRESGLAARLLLAWPLRRPKRWTETQLGTDWQDELKSLVEDLLTLEPHDALNGDPEPILIPLSACGKREWVKFYDEHAEEQVELDGDLAAVWSKLEGYAARLALVIHLVRSAYHEAKPEDENAIDAESIRAGVELSRWFGNEAKRIYVMLSESETDTETRRLHEWVQRKGGQVTVRLTQQSHRQYPTSEATRRALGTLVEAGLARWEDPTPTSRGGRRSDILTLLPTTPRPSGPDHDRVA